MAQDLGDQCGLAGPWITSAPECSWRCILVSVAPFLKSSILEESAKGTIQVLFASLVVAVGWVYRTKPLQQSFSRRYRIVVIVDISKMSACIIANGCVAVRVPVSREWTGQLWSHGVSIHLVLSRTERLMDLWLSRALQIQAPSWRVEGQQDVRYNNCMSSNYLVE